MQWSSEAKQALHKHVNKSTSQDPTSEIYNDIFTDLSAHVEEEIYQKGLSQVDTSSLQAVLETMGDDEFDDTVDSSSTDSAELLYPEPTERILSIEHKTLTSKYSGFKTFFAWLFTIVIPIVALIVELCNHDARAIFFDPIPTWIHVIFIALVPITFIVVYQTNRYARDTNNQVNIKRIQILKAMLGFTLPVIGYYTILFLPITPVALIGCILLLGFLPLSPLFCFVGWFTANASINRILNTQQYSTSRKWLKYGMLSGFLSLFLIEAPSYLAQKALRDAVSPDDKTSQQGIDNIRRFGAEDALLQLSYHGESRTRGFNGRVGTTPAHWVYNFFSKRRITSEQARILYYKVTGVPFNSVEPPVNVYGEQGIFGDRSWDEDHGGDAVAGVIKGLSLHSSRMDMHVDDQTRLGYVEWIIEFKNSQTTDKEARMQIAMPHKGFVSKLTLWVDGEERPAAFNTISKVKAAYKKIAVQQRRDPVLVNVSGADRVMLQCFPVPPNEGIMKMKVGITFPLSHSESSSGDIHFPYIAERNFSIKKELKHYIYAQADLQINAPNSTLDEAGSIKTLQYSLNNTLLKNERITWKDLTPANDSMVWPNDPFHKGEDK